MHPNAYTNFYKNVPSNDVNANILPQEDLNLDLDFDGKKWNLNVSETFRDSVKCAARFLYVLVFAIDW